LQTVRCDKLLFDLVEEQECSLSFKVLEVGINNFSFSAFPTLLVTHIICDAHVNHFVLAHIVDQVVAVRIGQLVVDVRLDFWKNLFGHLGEIAHALGILGQDGGGARHQAVNDRHAVKVGVHTPAVICICEWKKQYC
jgi:hypothetical protein